MPAFFAKLHHLARHRFHGHGHGLPGGPRGGGDRRGIARFGIGEENSACCPLCDKHCPLTAPACGKGRAHQEAKEELR